MGGSILGDPAWVAITVTLGLAVIGGFWVVIRFTIKRTDDVDVRQTQFRHAANELYNTNLQALETQLESSTREAEKSHRELITQLKDMALTMKDNFVSKPDLRDDLRQIHEAIVELRKDIGAVHTRIDEIYRTGLDGRKR